MNEVRTEHGGVGGIELVPVEVEGVQLGHVRVHQVGMFKNVFTSPIKTLRMHRDYRRHFVSFWHQLQDTAVKEVAFVQKEKEVEGEKEEKEETVS